MIVLLIKGEQLSESCLMGLSCSCYTARFNVHRLKQKRSKAIHQHWRTILMLGISHESWRSVFWERRWGRRYQVIRGNLISFDKLLSRSAPLGSDRWCLAWSEWQLSISYETAHGNAVGSPPQVYLSFDSLSKRTRELEMTVVPALSSLYLLFLCFELWTIHPPSVRNPRGLRF